jgi:hypothetical protein
MEALNSSFLVKHETWKRPLIIEYFMPKKERSQMLKQQTNQNSSLYGQLGQSSNTTQIPNYSGGNQVGFPQQQNYQQTLGFNQQQQGFPNIYQQQQIYQQQSQPFQQNPYLQQNILNQQQNQFQSQPQNFGMVQNFSQQQGIQGFSDPQFQQQSNLFNQQQQFQQPQNFQKQFHQHNQRGKPQHHNQNQHHQQQQINQNQQIFKNIGIQNILSEQPSQKTNYEQIFSNNIVAKSLEDDPDQEYLYSLDDDFARKDYLGEYIFKKIERHPLTTKKNMSIETIGKITGMILGIDDIKEITETCKNFDLLTSRITEALVLMESIN